MKSSRKYVLIGLPDDEDEYNEELVPSVCPFCNFCAYGAIQFEDYVDVPMLWCEECGARAVLDIDWNNDEGADLYDLVKKCRRMKVNSTPSTKHCDWIDVSDAPNYIYHKTPLCWITRVVNNELSEFFSDAVPSDDSMKEFIKRDYDVEYGKSIGIHKRDSLDEDEWNDETFWNLSMVCESYNVCDVIKTYSNCEIFHGGVYVYLKVKRGKTEECIRFWGD